MNLQIKDELIPGTKLFRAELNGVTGIDFLNKMFFISSGVMLSQIREVSGIDGSTLQNWTKRGWVANSKSKKYDMNQVAHILIINMLRSCMQLDKIAFLIEYINGKVDDKSDDIIEESVLYDYICKILDSLMTYEVCSLGSIREVIVSTIKNYDEKIYGAKERLTNALEIIVVAYYAALIKRYSDEMLDDLYSDSQKGVYLL